MTNKSFIEQMKNKKIAILTPTYYYWSGIDQVAKSHAEKLCKNNDVTVFALEGDIKPTKYDIVYFGNYKSDIMKRIYRLFYMFFRRNRHDHYCLFNREVVISHNYPMDVLAVRARKAFGCKYIAWFHGAGG